MTTVMPERYLTPEHRVAEVTAVDPDAGTILMRAAPYDVEAMIDRELHESFAPKTFAGALNAPHRVKLWNEHGGPLIGHAREVEDKDDGVWIRALISNTLAGQEARELARDGTLDQCSITFKALPEWMKVQRRDDGLHVRHSRAVLLGCAMVAHGAYAEGAYVASVRDAAADREREARRARILAWNH